MWCLALRRLVPALILGLTLPWVAATITAAHEILEHGHGHEAIAGLVALTHGHEHDADTPVHGHEYLMAGGPIPVGLAAMAVALSTAVELPPSVRAFPDRGDRPLVLPQRPFPGDLLRI